MKLLFQTLLTLVGVLVIAAPLSAAAFLPIGGKVVSVTVCPHIPGYIIGVAGFGVGSGLFWYLPGATITYLYGPPVVGEWVLGLSDVPFAACGASRATYTGTSPL